MVNSKRKEVMKTLSLVQITNQYKKEQRKDIKRQIGILSNKITALPLKAGHVGFSTKQFKFLSNKRAKLYEELIRI